MTTESNRRIMERFTSESAMAPPTHTSPVAEQKTDAEIRRCLKRYAARSL
jgi:hypothetical protein